MKQICPCCGELVRYKKRKGEFKPHQVATGTFRTFGPTFNRDLEPSLRSPGGPDAIGIPGGKVPEYAWCDGTIEVARSLQARGIAMPGLAAATSAAD
jgi:hypothetical protein